MPLAGVFIYPVICALLQKIATGWQGLVPSDWCRQCFTNPGNKKPLGNALRPPWGNQEYQNHRQPEEHMNSPAIILASKDSCTMLQGWEEKNRLFPEIRTITAHCKQWSFIKKHSPSLKQMPDEHKAAKRKISFSSGLRCTSVQTHHLCYLGSWLHSHHPNASLTRNSSLKNWGKTSSTLSHSSLI